MHGWKIKKSSTFIEEIERDRNYCECEESGQGDEAHENMGVSVRQSGEEEQHNDHQHSSHEETQLRELECASVHSVVVHTGTIGSFAELEEYWTEK